MTWLVVLLLVYGIPLAVLAVLFLLEAMQERRNRSALIAELARQLTEDGRAILERERSRTWG